MKNKKLLRLTLFGVEQTFKNKVWIIVNILMVIATIVAVNFNTVKEIINLKKSSENTDNKDIVKFMINDETSKLQKYILNENNSEIEVIPYEENKIAEGCIAIDVKYDDKNYIVATITSKEYIDISKYKIIEKAVNSVRNEVFSEKNYISIEEAEKLNTSVNINRVITEMDVSTYEENSSIFFIVTFILYFLFIFIASTLASTIGMEKISRTTEYMLTGISENAYLWYNILQTIIVVILQTALEAIYFLVASLINTTLIQSFLGAPDMENLISLGLTMSLKPIVVQATLILILQSILAIFILSIVQAVISSRVNNMSDVSNSTVLVLLFVIFATMFFPNIIPVKENVNIFFKIVSLIPVVSAVAVPKLLLLGQVNLVFAIISVIISVVVMIIATIFGSKLFKRGLLSINKGSKKEERVDKLIKNDLNSSKLKLSVSKVSMALIIYLICSNVLGIIQTLVLSTNSNVIVTYIVSILVWIAGIYPAYWYLKNSNYEKKEEQKKTSFKHKFIAILIAFGMLWIVQILSTLINTSEIDYTKYMNLDFSKVIYCVLAVIEIAVLPAIFEELLFRKAIFGSLKRYGVVFATICSSLAFGLVHQNLTQGIAAFFMGIVFCILVNNTGSIIPSMILHFINNLIGVLEMIFEQKSDAIFNAFSNIMGIIAIIFAVVSVIAIIVLKLKKYKFLDKIDNKLEVKNPIIVICTDFVTMITLFIYIVITVCVTKML